MILRFLFVAFTVILFGGCQKKSSMNSPSLVSEPQRDSLQERREAVEKSPSYENFIALGLELAKRQQHNEAISFYEQAAQINPKAPLAHNNICAAFNALQRFADAMESCQKALQLEPSFELAKNNLKYAQAEFEQFRSKVLSQKSDLMNKAKSSEDLINFGMQFFLARDLEAANKLWNRIPPSDSFYPAALNNLASSYILEGKWDEAEKNLNKALGLQPKNQLFSNNKRWLESKRRSQ